MLVAMTSDPGPKRLEASEGGLRRRDGTPLRVLIVEDEALVALDLSSIIEDLGGVVAGAAMTAAAGLRDALRLVPDVVLMDIRLPDGDGIEAARAIRAKIGTPIVFVTGNTDPVTLARVESLGYAPVARKPVTVEHLRKAILSACTA